MIEFTTGVAFLLSSMYGVGTPAVANAAEAVPSTPTTQEKAPVVVMQDRKAVENYLRKEFDNTPILIQIARCESTFTQFDKDGKVIRGKVNSNDVGVMQINEKYHLETATKLGYDLHTIEGNVAFAKYLYKRDGASPWSASAKCWSAS